MTLSEALHRLKVDTSLRAGIKGNRDWWLFWIPDIEEFGYLVIDAEIDAEVEKGTWTAADMLWFSSADFIWETRPR